MSAFDSTNHAQGAAASPGLRVNASTSSSNSSTHVKKTLADVLANDECMKRLFSVLTIREVHTLRYLRALKTHIDHQNAAQEKLFYRGVIPDPVSAEPVELELNPLLFARRHKYIKNGSISFCELRPGHFELHLETNQNIEILLNNINWRGKDAILTRPSQKELEVHIRAHRPNPPMMHNPPPPAITAIGRVTVRNNTGITYGDLLREAVELGKKQGAAMNNSYTMELMFPGQTLHLGKYIELYNELSSQQRAWLGI